MDEENSLKHYFEQILHLSKIWKKLKLDYLSSSTIQKSVNLKGIKHFDAMVFSTLNTLKLFIQNIY